MRYRAIRHVTVYPLKVGGGKIVAIPPDTVVELGICDCLDQPCGMKLLIINGTPAGTVTDSDSVNSFERDHSEFNEKVDMLLK